MGVHHIKQTSLVFLRVQTLDLLFLLCINSIQNLSFSVTNLILYADILLYKPIHSLNNYQQ